MFHYSISNLASVTGTLKGYDQLMNLVLDDVKETMRGRPYLELQKKLMLIVYR